MSCYFYTASTLLCVGILPPRWTVEPDIDSITRTIIPVLQDQKAEPTVSFLAQGAFNKIYNIADGGRILVLRVSLPVDPGHKTLSEVATIDWTRRHTSLPAPELIAHEATRANPIGFEWILMGKIPGKPLVNMWNVMTLKAKKQSFRGTGNIFPDSHSPWDDADDDADNNNHASVAVKRIVSMQSFWGEHMKQDIPRGPFRSTRHGVSNDWTSDDEDEAEDAQRSLDIVTRLKSSINDVFPPRGDD
ncbi:hypothetical protein B0T26DRAFT_743343 [Lasiosphaeria miniovina]|uniref:Aminoglycoside phosphotransferase domain-containing protein n=1 Tax=Lasiosphaeria miniovina TaxID=1954250 RepID=A0AA40DNX7_9PEZI|nr:uncharacterized protein B0T26DRAFT_743343 [Lasiosphaeria miniovina]KAK0710210.1 hypothetical protein B0T26DRAFT_743343 [Lasiosphaeria miniovina]